MDSSRITQVASIIGDNITKINQYLSSQGLPTPSFEPDVRPSFLKEKPIAAACQAVLEATDELHALILGPIGILTSVKVRATS